MPMEFLLPETLWEPPEILPDLRGYDLIAADTETKDDGLARNMGPGWVYGAGYICGVSMAAGDQSVYVPIRHPDTECHDEDAVRRWVDDHMKAPVPKVFHNAPYDLGWMKTQWGIKPPELLEDTMAMAFIVDENRLEFNLDAVCRDLGITGKDESLLRQAADAYGCDPKKDLWRLPGRFVGPYAAQDAVATLKAAELMFLMMEKDDLMDAYRLEVDLIPMILEMRTRGIRIDTTRAAEVREQLLADRDEALHELSRNATIGRDITIKDVNSPMFMEKLFTAESISFPRTPKTEQGSFSSEWMERHDHWLPKLATVALKMHDAGEKFIGNYIMNFTHLGRLHAEVHQFKSDRGGTRTTRFSYSDPPLQQMPSRNPRIAKAIRGLFMPEYGDIWGALDYSQQEFRLMVHFAYVCCMVGVEKARQMYIDDPATDFHDLAAQLTKLPRRKAKDVNFAKAFGAGVLKFALMTGMSIDEAKETMTRYDEELPFISRLSEFCQKRADRKGFIRLLDGARYRFDRWEPRWNDWNKNRAAQDEAKLRGESMSIAPCGREEALQRVNSSDHPWSGIVKRAFTHKAMNGLIQGSAARQTKLAMRICWQEGIVPILQMHDELDFSLPASPEGEKQAKRAAEIMRETTKLEVPNIVDSEFGVNWGSAKATDDYGATFKEAVACL